MFDRVAYENRRLEFRHRRPTHFCRRCTSVLFADDAACLECGAARGEAPWPPLDPVDDPWLGRILSGRYLLSRQIGEGASAMVYRAESLTIARQFAVKIVALKAGISSISSDQAQARLNREIGALGQLRNPHIVSFYDVIPIDERAVALVMDLIEGFTLQDIVNTSGRLELGRALRILRQIANGVHEAHEADMIHRDLKPENIMIERLPAGDDFVHILDFGIVHRPDDVRVTQGFLGTPLYASPEQARGDALDRRTDIYALGGVFFFMLTGRPPFMDDNVYRVLKAQIHTPAPRLAEVAPQAAFPEAIEALVARMLAKKPAERPQSLSEIIDALDGLVFAPAEHSVHSDAHHGAMQEETEASSPGISAPEEDQPAATVPGNARFSRVPHSGILRGRNLERVHEALDAMNPAIDDLYALPEHWCANGLEGMLPPPDGTLRAHITENFWALVSADGRLMTGDRQGRVFTWEISALPPITAIHRREHTVASGHADGSVRRWKPGTPTPELIHAGTHSFPITALSCSGAQLLAGNAGGALFIADIADIGVVPVPLVRVQTGPPVHTVAIADKSRPVFAVARGDGHIDIYHASAPATRVQRIVVRERVEQLAFSHDGYMLAVVFQGNHIALYQALTATEVVRRDTMARSPLSIHFDSRDQLVGYCRVGEQFYGWNLQDHLFSPHKGYLYTPPKG